MERAEALLTVRSVPDGTCCLFMYELVVHFGAPSFHLFWWLHAADVLHSRLFQYKEITQKSPGF